MRGTYGRDLRRTSPYSLTSPPRSRPRSILDRTDPAAAKVPRFRQILNPSFCRLARSTLSQPLTNIREKFKEQSAQHFKRVSF